MLTDFHFYSNMGTVAKQKEEKMAGKNVQVPQDKIRAGRTSLSCVVTLCEATKKKLQKKIDDYFRAYNPMGYDTRIVKQPAKHPDGYWHCEINRLWSCD